MNFFVATLVGSLIVFQAFKLIAPMPDKLNTKIIGEASSKERALQTAMMEDFSPRSSFTPQPSPILAVAPSPYAMATPARRWEFKKEIKHTNKPLVSFERYLARQKKLKQQKRSVASVSTVKKAVKVKKHQAKKPSMKRNQKMASNATRV